MDSIIELSGITKRFGNRTVLDGIDLSVKKNDIISIMGESGAGKTTMLNILGFLDMPSSGRYFFENKEVRGRNQMAVLRNSKIGFVFQAYNLIPKLTVYENIALPVYYSMDTSAMKKRYIDGIPGLLERFNIGHIKNDYVDYISGGEKQRVCLARALVCMADVIISDEPTGNLDKDNSDIVLNEFTRLSMEGKTVIIVTHDAYAAGIADKRYILKEGKLIKNEI